MFTKTITVYNLKREGRDDAWKRTVLKETHYENVHGIKLGDRSIQTDSSTDIIIKDYKGFMKPKQYQREGGDKNWTLAPNDMVVLGELTQEIKDASDLEAYDDVRTIKSYDVVDYASDPSLNNITVVAK